MRRLPFTAASRPRFGRPFRQALALLLAAAGLSPATVGAALPVDPAALSVAPAAARIGESVTWTVRGRPGQFAGIAYSVALSGATFQGTPLALGADARLLGGGPVDSAGRFAVTLVVASGVATGAYYFQAVLADDPAFTTNATLSAGATVTVSAAPPPVTTLAGRVTDVGRSGAPVSNVVIEVDGGQFRAVTGADGGFVIPGLPPGTHTVRTQATGFTSTTIPALELREATRDLSLALLRTFGNAGPADCPCTLTVRAPTVGTAQVTVVAQNPQVTFRASGASPVTVQLTGPVRTYDVTVSAPGFLTVTLPGVLIPPLAVSPYTGQIAPLDFEVVLPPA